MSEPVAKPRSIGDHRNPFDLDEIERRMRESIQESTAAEQRQSDPLAELARLVGSAGSDPFSKVFANQGDAQAKPSGEPAPVWPPDPSLLAFPPNGVQGGGYDTASGQPYQQYAPQDYAQNPAYGQQQGQDYYGYDTYSGDQQSQDAPWLGQPYAERAYPGYEEEQPRRTGRAKLLIGAAAAVVVAGLGGAYVLSSGGPTSREAPTILANPGPTKVQPADPVQDAPKQSVSVLERGAAGNTQSKVVQTEEQPVDIGATARSSGQRPVRANDTGAPVTLAPPPPPPVPNSLFAEPKRVKAVTVLPDGTIVDGNAPAAPPAPSKPAGPAASTPTPPSPPARPTDMASLVAATASPGSPAAKPAPSTPPSRPPANATAAAAAPTTTASIPAAPAGGSGSFSVQLAGTTSAEEAKDAVDRAVRRFSSELGGLRPSVVKAEVGSKTVYRVRVKGLSSDDANTLCARLKASGGSCFVARD